MFSVEYSSPWIANTTLAEWNGFDLGDKSLSACEDDLLWYN